MWDSERQRQALAQDGADDGSAVRVTVQLVLPASPGGAAGPVTLEVAAGEWSPLQYVAELERGGGASGGGDSGGLAGDTIVAARVDGELRDLATPVSAACTVELVPFASDDGRKVLWHSAAHVLGGALEKHYGDAVHLCDGPALSEGDGGQGFFYEMWLRDSMRVHEGELPALQKTAKKAVKQKQRFDRMQVTKDFAADMFRDNRFKLEMLASIPDEEAITLYRCGRFVDLCRGPHVQHTGLLKGFLLDRCSGSHWRSMLAASGASGAGEVDAAATAANTAATFADAGTGTDGGAGEGGDDEPPLLQRVYGIAFPSAAELSAWETMREEARKRDHRVVGRDQQLFFFHDMSPGSAFFLPAGTSVYNRLVEMLRREYTARGYREVMSPLIYKKKLWETSGHMDNYAENMFFLTGGDKLGHGDGAAGSPRAGGAVGHHAHHTSPEDEDGMGLKPMNCPGHCLIFAQRRWSYKDLPLRIADFSALHRNEATGALGGLTRVRRFQQDDAHIFCAADQVGDEVRGCLEFIRDIYARFGFTFRMLLSTRPDKSVGSDDAWAEAEAALHEALDSMGHAYVVNEGDGAFYGPKIDVVVTDAIGREHQCATVQLDFQLPQRFDLHYDGAAGSHRPVMIHRAILGSVERMMAILIEHTGGKWPFWLSPRQVVVCPVAERHAEYATAVCKALQDAGFHAEVDATAKTVPKRVRDAQLAQANLIIVTGDVEEAAGTVAVRFRDAAMADSAAQALRDIGHTAGLDQLASTAHGRPALLSLAQVELVALCRGLSDGFHT